MWRSLHALRLVEMTGKGVETTRSVGADGHDGVAIVEGCLDVLSTFLDLAERDVIA